MFINPLENQINSVKRTKTYIVNKLAKRSVFSESV